MKDQVIIITGASSGIGRALAQALANKGAKLVLAARDVKRLDDLSASLPDAIAVPTDVTDPDACRNLVERAVSHYGRIDVLVNNAGISMTVYFDQIQDLSLFRKIMDVNYFGSVYCTYYALPHLKASRGLIVAISSVTGKTGVPTRTAYAASKHAMQGFFDSLRIELLGTGVDVLVVSPGYVQSEVRIRALGADAKPLGHSHIEESNAMTAEACADIIVSAMERRARDIIIASWRIKLAQWLKLIAPSRLDKMALQAVKSGRS